MGFHIVRRRCSAPCQYATMINVIINAAAIAELEEQVAALEKVARVCSAGSNQFAFASEGCNLSSLARLVQLFDECRERRRDGRRERVIWSLNDFPIV